MDIIQFGREFGRDESRGLESRSKITAVFGEDVSRAWVWDPREAGSSAE